MLGRSQFEDFLTLICRTFVCLAFIFGPMRTPALANEPTDFRTQVVPVLTKLGCNAGSCHGSAAGRGDFKLSLYGSRPQDDFRAIVLDGKGRRINRADFLKSLVLRKPGGELDHGGDQLFDLDDESGQIIANWIRQGAKFENKLRLKKLDVGTSPLILKRHGTKHQFRIQATFSDGTQKDVTRWTVLTSNDTSSVSIDEETNIANIVRPGRHVVIARYMDQVAPIEIIVPYGDLPNPNVLSAGENFVDDYVCEKLNQLGIQAARQTDDASFFRRLTLDLTGRLPKPGNVQSFLADNDTEKRKRLVDNLLESEAFVDYWTYRIARQLRIRSQQNDKIGVRVYHNWLRKKIADKRSWKEIAGEMLLAKGDSHQTGQANFYRTTGDARLQAEFVTESLMGVKLRCANCHNHPLDHWTQDDYHGLAAIFAKVKQTRFVTLNPSGENIHANTGKPAKPRVPGEFFIDTDETDVRTPLARWMLEKENPYFARAMVNRIWQALLGRGLVEPVDDLRSTNPATHPALLKRMADDFIEHGYDIRHTIAKICTSKAYQRSVGDPKAPEYQRLFYANATVRPLPPEVLSDAIADVTGIFDKYPGYPLGTRAVQLADPKTRSASLDILGRCSRDESCESGGGDSATGLSTQLHLLNGGLVNQKIEDQVGHLAVMINSESKTNEIVDFFYTQAFGRQPKQTELDFWIEQIDSKNSKPNAKARIQQMEDFVWSILNSKEFATNH